MPLPLAGFRVLDFSWVVAGPYAGSLQACMGAEVIKIESRNRVDFSRRSAVATVSKDGDVDASLRFAEMNLNKMSVQLDLREPEALALVRRLVSVSDVVIENYRSGVMDRLGLGYAALCHINPDIVMLSSSMAGGTGPDADQPGYAPVFNAISGLGYITGYDDGPPTELRASVDLRVAFSASFALLCALYHRRRTGKGQHIDLSSTEAISTLIGHLLVAQQFGGEQIARQGNRDSHLAPHDCYRCAGDDAWVSIAVGTRDEWRALCRTIERPELSGDERFAEADARRRNQDLLRPFIEAWTSRFTHWEATERLQAAGVAAAPSFTFEDLANDRHVVDREETVQVQHPRLGLMTTTRVPWKLSAFPEVPYRPAPLMGQHNQYVFGEVLGIGSKELTDLIERKVIC